METIGIPYKPTRSLKALVSKPFCFIAFDGGHAGNGCSAASTPAGGDDSGSREVPKWLE